MIIECYIIATFLLVSDEIWNIKNPRPFPVKKYHALKWEKKDFYSYKINNEWVLRKYRKTDDETKRYVRNEYWKKRANFKK
jgi:plasmid maintenance system killer protein